MENTVFLHTRQQAAKWCKREHLEIRKQFYA